MIPLKIYGERNSGTNYLEQLMTINFEIALLKYIPPKWIAPFIKYQFQNDLLIHFNQKKDLGWKHGFPPPQIIKKHKEQVILLSITKNPYRFLWSLYNRPYHFQGDIKSLDFSSFIRCKWKTLLRDNSSSRFFKNPVMLWNAKNKSYLSLVEQFPEQALVVSYEQLISKPAAVLKNIETSFQINRHNNSYVWDLPSTKKENKYFKDYVEEYKSEEWKSNFSKEDLVFINNQLDAELVTRLGYTILPV